MSQSEPTHRSPGVERSRDARAIRVFGLRVDQLHMRLALGVAFTVVGFLGVGFWAFSSHHFDSSIAAQQRAAELQTRLVEAALQHAMLEQDSKLITFVLRSVSADPSVRGAMILDHEGEIRHASDEALVGTRIPLESQECAVCHATDPSSRDRWILMRRDEEMLLRSVLPIENRRECHACHGTEAKLNGMLVMDTSMADLEAALRTDTTWFVIGTAVLTVLLLGAIGVFVRRLILNRLARLSDAARSIAAGNLSDRVRVGGTDVIASLAADFNDMADNVDRLVHEVRAQQSQMQDVMNSLDDGLVVLDADSRIVACNRSFGRRIGQQSEAVEDRRCSEGAGGALPCCSSELACPAALCRETGDVQRAVFRSQGDDGETKSIEEVLASPITDEHGRVVRVVEIWRDITERVKEEESLAEIERMVSLGALASGFSHEVNTPLATVLTCAESMLDQLDGRSAGSESVLPAIRDHAGVIRDQVLRCRRITEQFLRFSRGIPPSIEPIDLPRVVSNVVDLVAPTAREKGITLRHATDGPLPPVQANSEVVQHVVLNLLINALQSFDHKRGAVEITYCRDGGVRLLVRDEGSGIEPHERDRLFEPFRSRKPGGTGLGLFLSRSFMRRFGGDVRLVESQVGIGSCFEVIFAPARVGD